MYASFRLKDVLELCDHALTAKEHAAGYEAGHPRPGLVLVGDDGVYLMSNGLPPLPRRDGKPGNRVVYAHGMNPETDDDWYDTKVAVFGGDDGADLLPYCDSFKAFAAQNPGASWLVLDITPEAVTVVGVASTLPPD